MSEHRGWTDLSPEETDAMFEADANRKKWCICGHSWMEHDGNRECWADASTSDGICRCPLFSERPTPDA